ncbi:B-cell receptor CD22-like [Rhinichthys klamathensis goyatoka]|uniref:B-cell receptor CD22-like n=1 Tax=Rhinichthys klamathensis goyatoka TaxID=3034132 RepID=UPI0024B5EA8D|nr:B-cell receptor CD22-like [Rhinichthys klamathensis goyatoka]
MAPPLPLIFFLLMIHGVSSDDWSVSYSPSHICALKDSTVIMRCTYTYPTGYQIKEVFWTKTKYTKKDEVFPDLSDDTEYSQRLQYLGDKQQNCTVRLSHVTLKDSHMYYFRFITDKENWIGYPGVNLTVTDLQVESPERVTEGDSVSLTCKSSCALTDRATFIWYRNSQPLTERRDRNNELLLQSVRREDSGRYSCAVDGHTPVSPDVQLNVMYPPKSVLVSISPSGVIVEGDSVTLNCISDSNPPAEIRWFKGGTIVGSGRIYNISKISSDDSGEYKCKSINEHGEKYSDTVTLNVMYPPRSVSVFMSGSGVIVEGDSVTLNCISDSNPPALNFSWFKENETSAVGSGQSFSALQSGRFYCQAHNQHGSQRSDAVTVTVHHVAGRNVIVIAAASGGIFIIIIIIIILFIIARKRINRQSAIHKCEDDDPGSYAALDLKSRSSDLYDTLTTVHPRPDVHQSDSDRYENLAISERSSGLHITNKEGNVLTTTECHPPVSCRATLSDGDRHVMRFLPWRGSCSSQVQLSDGGCPHCERLPTVTLRTRLASFSETALPPTAVPRRGSRCLVMMSVCLGLICVLLLVFITLYITITAERDLLKSYKDTVEEFNHTINSLQDKNTDLMTEKDQLKNNFSSLSQKKLELETRVNDLSAEKSQLQGSVDALSQKKLELETELRKLYTQGNDTFFMSNEPKSWSESRKYCRDRGADLVIINTEEKQRFITALVKEKVWIGLSDSETEGIMKWVDNSPLKQGFWFEGQPNSYAGDEDCILLVPTDTGLNNWHDYPCSDKRKSVCEK